VQTSIYFIYNHPLFPPPGIGSGGLYFAILALSCAFMRVFGGRLADKAGERPIVYLGSASLVISMLLLVLWQNTAAFLVKFLGYAAMFT